MEMVLRAAVGVVEEKERVVVGAISVVAREAVLVIRAKSPRIEYDENMMTAAVDEVLLTVRSFPMLSDDAFPRTCRRRLFEVEGHGIEGRGDVVSGFAGI